MADYWPVIAGEIDKSWREGTTGMSWQRREWREDDGTDASRISDVSTPVAALAPRCLRCGSTEALTCLPYGSIHCGKYVCARCLDLLLAQGPVKFWLK